MENGGGNWQRFRKLRFDSRNVSRRMQRAETATSRHARKFIFQRLNNMREVRREIITWLVIVGLMICAVVGQIFWFSQSYMTTAASVGGNYAEGSLGPISTLNPLYATSDAEQTAARLIFSSLYQYDETGHLTSDLASSTSVNENGTHYTVKLRPDARWQDGDAVTANDVIFTIKLIKDPNARSNLAVNWQDISVKALNQATVEFTLPAAYAAFSQALTFPVLPEHLLRDVTPANLRQAAFSNAPIGSGPFRYTLSQAAPGSHDDKIVRLTANQDYYGGAPKLAHFDIHSFTGDKEMVRALKTGEVTATSGLAPDQVPKALESRYQTINRPIDSGVYALFNNNNAILKEKNVRLALRQAVDTKKLRSELPGDSSDLYLPFINGQIGDQENLPEPIADVSKARAALDAAGWKMDGNVRVKDGVKLALTITTIKNPMYEKASRIVAEDWREVGVNVTMNVIDPNQADASFVQNVLQPRNFDVLVYELVIGADPDVYAYWSSSQVGATGYNFSGYSNIIADATLSSARSISNQTTRQAKYRVFANQWLQDAPAFGLYQGMSSYVVNRSAVTMDTQSILVSPTDRFSNILYWSTGKRPVYKTP